MANLDRERWLDSMQRLVYDGTTDVDRFLKSFETCRSKLLQVDPDTDEETVFFYFLQALKDSSTPPKRGGDGEKYVGPETWLDRQPFSEIDTYDKLKAKLEFKFRAKIDNRAAVIARLAKMERKHRTVQLFARDFDEICGDLDFDDEILITIFIKQMPVKVFDRLDWFYPDFRTRTYSSVKNNCIAFDNALRNPFPLEPEALARINREIAQHKARKARLEQGTLCSAKDLSSNRNYSSAQTYGKRDAIHAPHSYENVHGGNMEQSVCHDIPFLDEAGSSSTPEEFAQSSGARESSKGAEHVQLAVPPAEDSNDCGQEDPQFSEHVEQPDSPGIAKPVPTSSAGPFTHSTAAGSPLDGHDRVEPLVHPAVSKVFIVKRFNQCPLDVKAFLPTVDHTRLESFRSEDRTSRLGSGSDPPPHTTPQKELRRVGIESLDVTDKTIAGSRDGCSLHISTPTGRSTVKTHWKMVDVHSNYVRSEYQITRLGPGPEPPPERDVRSLDFGYVKLTLLMIDSWRTFACIYRARGAHSRRQQHSLIPYYVDNPEPDPEPPPGCLNGSPDGEDQVVGAGRGSTMHASECGKPTVGEDPSPSSISRPRESSISSTPKEMS
jgi:hypothetical protein